MAKEIYDELFGYYGIQRNHPKIKTIRVQIMRQLKKLYKTKDWNELSEYEKSSFKLIHMHKYLIKYSRNPKNVEAKIQKEHQESLIQLQSLHEHNNRIDKLYKEYFDPSMSEEEQINAYKEFCADLKEGFPGVLPPSFAVWINNPLRIFDYISDPYSEIDSAAVELASIPQEKVDHEVLECILQIIKEKWNVEIDITAIRQCLLAVKDIDHINTDKLPDDINYNPDSPVEEPQKINQNTLALIDAANKLKNHDFIVDC